MCLANRYLAMAVFSDFSIPAFRRLPQYNIHVVETFHEILHHCKEGKMDHTRK
jgi:hypothetical protein